MMEGMQNAHLRHEREHREEDQKEARRQQALDDYNAAAKIQEDLLKNDIATYTSNRANAIIGQNNEYTNAIDLISQARNSVNLAIQAETLEADFLSRAQYAIAIVLAKPAPYSSADWNAINVV